jgi:hypothetical protein
MLTIALKQSPLTRNIRNPHSSTQLRVDSKAFVKYRLCRGNSSDSNYEKCSLDQSDFYFSE